jgi:hypothetical protein
MNRLSIQCGILDISQPYRRPRPITGIDLLRFLTRSLLECDDYNILYSLIRLRTQDSVPTETGVVYMSSEYICTSFQICKALFETASIV